MLKIDPIVIDKETRNLNIHLLRMLNYNQKETKQVLKLHLRGEKDREIREKHAKNIQSVPN